MCIVDHWVGQFKDARLFIPQALSPVDKTREKAELRDAHLWIVNPIDHTHSCYGIVGEGYVSSFSLLSRCSGRRESTRNEESTLPSRIHVFFVDVLKRSSSSSWSLSVSNDISLAHREKSLRRSIMKLGMFSHRAERWKRICNEYELFVEI